MRKIPAKEKIFEAHQMFIKLQGNISNAEMARRVGTTRQTISKHRNGDNWDAELVKLKQEVDEKVTKEIVAKIANDLDPLYNDAADNLKGLNAIIRLKLFKRNERGDIMRSSDGTPQIDGSLSAKEINQLVMASERYVKTMRLLHGESTSNNANFNKDANSPAGNNGQGGPQEPGNKAMEKVIEKAGAGDADAQQALTDFAMILQRFDTISDSDGECIC